MIHILRFPSCSGTLFDSPHLNLLDNEVSRPPSLYFPSTLACVVRAACNYGTSSFPREPSVPVSKFSYIGLTGPLNWFGLNETANFLCDKGMNQSPIDITPSAITLDNGTSCTVSVPSYPSGAAFENLGTNVEIVVNGSLLDRGKKYDLAQFHFHTPSEHRVNEEIYAMELHFVFEAADKSISVVAFLIELGPTDPFLASVFSSISAITKPGDATLTGPLYFEALESCLAGNTIYRYTGSLTTPPCSEDVNWIISSKPLYIDSETFKFVKSVLKFNARYTQDGLGQVNLLQNAANELDTRSRDNMER